MKEERERALLIVFCREDLKDYFQENFTNLQSLTLHIPPHHSIPPSLLSHFTSLTSLSLSNLNPACADAFGALVTQSPHLRALTYLTRPWEGVLPFSYGGLALETLEVNQIDFEDIVHMASSLKSLKVFPPPHSPLSSPLSPLFLLSSLWMRTVHW